MLAALVACTGDTSAPTLAAASARRCVLQAEAREEQAEWRQAARGIAVEQSHLQRLVRDYLVTNAHVDTLAHFEAATRPCVLHPGCLRACTVHWGCTGVPTVLVALLAQHRKAILL